MIRNRRFAAVAWATAVALLSAAWSSAVATASAIDGPASVAETADGRVVVARSDPDEILVFAVTASGNTAPVRIIAGYRSDLYAPHALAVDGDGDIFALTHHDGCDAVVEYGLGASGDTMPKTEISGDKTGLCAPVSSLAVDRDGDIFVAHDDGDRVDEFAAGSDGDLSPSHTLFGQRHAALHGVRSLAVAEDGSLLVASVRQKTDNEMLTDPVGNFVSPDVHYPPDIRVFAERAYGDTDPTAVVQTLAWAIGAAGPTILSIPDAGGGPAPQIDLWSLDGARSGEIAGDRTRLTAPIAASGNDNDIVVLDDRCQGLPGASAAVLFYSARAHDNAAPRRTIAGAKTHLGCP